MRPPNTDRTPIITVSAPTDIDALAGKWLALQSRADGSFFQSWAWTGCLAKERFTNPVLLEAHCDGQTVALALFNLCRHGLLAPWVLRLGESGQASLDATFIEHNGPLLAIGYEHLVGPCLRAAIAEPFKPRHRRLILSGIDEPCLLAARSIGGTTHIVRSAPAPILDFSLLDQISFLDSRSPNTRYQMRRSHRLYSDLGPLAIRRAGCVEEAWHFLGELATLHQRTWTARDKPGAFADPTFLRFHRTLIERAFPQNTADLLCITAGPRVIGYLYNFSFLGRVSAYQSGFDYTVTSPHQKPGLTCHHLAIEMYRRQGLRSYDFLAGSARYKTSLSNTSADMHWLEITASVSPVAWIRKQVLLLKKKQNFFNF